MRELKRKKDAELPMDLPPQAPVPLGADEKPRAALSSPDRRSPDYGVRRLTKLLGVARMLTSELDLAEIVRQVLVRAIEVIPAADAGTLYLADSKLAASSSRILSVSGPAFSSCRSSRAKLPREEPLSPGAGRSIPIRKPFKKPSPTPNQKPTAIFVRRACAPRRPRWRRR